MLLDIDFPSSPAQFAEHIVANPKPRRAERGSRSRSAQEIICRRVAASTTSIGGGGFTASWKPAASRGLAYAAEAVRSAWPPPRPSQNHTPTTTPSNSASPRKPAASDHARDADQHARAGALHPDVVAPP